MKCCVSWCSNTKSKLSSESVSYHKFPVENFQQQTWIAALGIDDRQLTDDSVVCSIHFIDECFYSGESGLRIVHRGAMPFVQVCVVCLDTERRVHPLSKYNLEQAYETITGLELQGLTNFTPCICFECAQRLTQCKQFRDKSARGHALLVELIRKHELLTVQYIKTINRSDNFLTSNLVEKVFQPNHCDLNFIDNKKETIEIEYEDRVNKSTIKIEKDDHILVFDDKTQYENCTDLEKRDIKDDDTNVDFLDDVFSNNDDGDELLNDNAKIDNNYSEKDDISDSEKSIDRNENDSDIELVHYKKDKPKTSDAKKLKRSRKINLASYKNCNNKISKTNKNNLTKKVSVAKTRTGPVKSKVKLDKVNTKKLNANKRDTCLTIFKMTKLSLEEQIEDVKKRQESSNYKNSSFQCNFCYRGFICKSTFTRHMDKHSKANGDVECPVCKQRYKTRIAFLKHNQSHTTRYNCTLCEFFSMNSESARMHERWHKGTKYKCPHCEEEFSKYTTYITHLRVKHPSDFICGHCGYSFISQKGLEYHIHRTHRTEKTEEPAGPQCEECKVRFSSLAAYEQHLKVSPKHHKPEMRERNQSLPRRMYKKDNAPPYVTCEQCGIKLNDFTMYIYHFKREHPGDVRAQHAPRPREVLCEQCGRSFQTAFHLKEHMTKHTGQKDYQCDVCEKRFRTKVYLDKHKETHAATRPLYSCPVCGKSFTSPSSRNRHVWIHKEKTFKCDICEKAFSNGSDRNTHVSHVHMKVPWPKRNRGPGKMRRTKDTYDE
ncbi:zinc finger protein 184 [Bicyclus anynana]|uniref:Zinc finger protein 184 n=1 Tax=Bicyclus anynana TaxID=110368 RepID=A0ABM3M464_BICAN|nr:zinc finger protein 184 [Bicyclus anynana]